MEESESLVSTRRWFSSASSEPPAFLCLFLSSCSSLPYQALLCHLAHGWMIYVMVWLTPSFPPSVNHYLLSQPYNCPEYVTLLFRDIPWLPTYEVKSRLSSWHQRSVHFLSVCFLSLQFTLIFTVYFLSFSFPMYFYQNWFTNCIKNILYSVFHSKNTYWLLSMSSSAC